MPVLELNNLTKNYGNIQALDGLDLSIEPGQVYGLLGPNGSGKTTTLAIILGILSQTSGSYTWFNNQYGEKYRLRIGAILETPNFYPYKNAQQNLEIIRHIKGLPKQDFTSILETVNLAHRKESSFRTYSLGMKQRLAIAATLIGNPEVVIFDEPTNGLDPQGIMEVRSILKNVADSGRTVILASHILDEVEKICSHVAIIKNGKLLATGSVGSILSNDMTLELASENLDNLSTILRNVPWIKRISKVDDKLECAIEEGHSIREINKLAFENQIILTHMVSRKKRLEEEFLEITSKA